MSRGWHRRRRANKHHHDRESMIPLVLVILVSGGVWLFGPESRQRTEREPAQVRAHSHAHDRNQIERVSDGIRTIHAGDAITTQARADASHCRNIAERRLTPLAAGC